MGGGYWIFQVLDSQFSISFHSRCLSDINNDWNNNESNTFLVCLGILQMTAAWQKEGRWSAAQTVWG